jgi:arylformamidase
VKILDITHAMGASSVMWPGQEPPKQVFAQHTDRGDSNTLSLWSMSAHTGTHMDARMHFIPGGWSMESLDLARCVGPCRVVDLTGVGDHVEREHLEGEDVAGTARLLLKTRNSTQRLLEADEFDEGYVAISRDAAEYLVEIGVETVGVDYLSVEPFPDKEFNTHHTLLGADVLILEGLNLAEVEPGEYLLVCLPLKLEGSDGSPARAILISDL